MSADNEGPDFSGVPEDIELACKDPTLPHANLPEVANVTSFDACDRQAYNVSFEEVSKQGRCPQELFYNRSWVAQDQCGNIGLAFQRLHIVDYVPPTINTQPQDLVVECDRGSHGEVVQAWLNSSGGALAVDECGTTVTWSYNLTDLTVLKESCDGSENVVVLFTATDECGNEVNTTATVLITDTKAPLIAKDAEVLELECNTATNQGSIDAWLANAANSEAIDQCSRTVNVTSTLADAVPGCASAYTQDVVVFFTDSCGLTTNTTSQVIVQDSSVPVLTLAGSNPQQTEAGFAWVDPGVATVLDDCEGDITSRSSRNNDVDINVLGGQSIVYQAVDACGMVGNITRIVNVVDTLPPRVVAPAPTIFRMRAGTTYQPPSGITAVDSFDGELDSSAIRFEPADFSNKEGVHSIFAVATDSSGNEARVPVQTVYVLPTSPVDAGQDIQSARLEMPFDTELAVRNPGKPSIAVSLFIRFGTIRSNQEAQQFLSEVLGTSGYPLPFCIDYNGHSFCRVDTPEMSASMLDSIASQSGVVALSSKGMPVQDFHLGLPNPDAKDIEVLQTELQRLGADSVASIGCDMGFCRFRVSRQEVNSAVPVARPHPHSRFVMDSDGQDAEQIEAELLGAGLMPLAVRASGSSMIVDVPDYINENVLNSLEGVAVNLQGSIQHYFRMTFNMTLTDDAAPWSLYQALYSVGLSPETVETQGNGTYVVTTSTSVHSIMLAKLTSDPTIATVTPVQPLESSEKLVVSFPLFTYILDIDLDLDEDPEQNVTITPQLYAQQVAADLANGRAATALCSSPDGRSGNCQLRTSFELTAEQLAVTRDNSDVLTRFVVDEINSLQDDIEAAAEDWIGTLQSLL
jgi:hypothetical protein